MKRLYIINFEHCECYLIKRCSVCAFTDIDKAKTRLKELSKICEEETLTQFRTNEIAIDSDATSYSIYLDYNYDRYHIDYWIDEVEIEN